MTSDPFEPVEIELESGMPLTVRPTDLFHMDALDEGEVAWNPRWDLIANDRDPKDLQRTARPIWKIHGSPFFLACPKCRGINRWKSVQNLRVGDPCPVHPEVPLEPEIIFWSEKLDHASARVWGSLRRRMNRSDLLVVVGHSGSDDYIRAEIEARVNAWIVSPTSGSWDTRRVKHVEPTASQLAVDLRTGLL